MGTTTLTSVWRGSETSRQLIMREIESRYGREEALNYSPTKNCFTLISWRMRGYRVKPGERGMKMVTYIEKKADDEGSKKLYPKTIYLFYVSQVEKIQ